MSPPPARGGANGASTSGTKKRGRPRKNRPDGTAPAATRSYSQRVPSSSRAPIEHKQDKTPTSKAIGKDWSSISIPCNSFMPHMITVSPAEDVAWKIAQATQQGRRGIVIMSAKGMLQKVALIDPANDAGVIREEGQFKIIQMSGSFMIYDKEGTRSGGIAVHLADSDGRALMGTVGGALIAATPVQVFIGSFAPGPHTIAPKSETPGPEPNAETPGPEPNAEKPGPEPNAGMPGPEPNEEKPGPEPNVGMPGPEPNAGTPGPEPNAGVATSASQAPSGIAPASDGPCGVAPTGIAPPIVAPSVSPPACDIPGVAPFDGNQIFDPPNPNFGFSFPPQGEDSVRWWNNAINSLEGFNDLNLFL